MPYFISNEKYKLFLFCFNRLVCKFEGAQIVLDDKGEEYEEFKQKFTGKSCIIISQEI